MIVFAEHFLKPIEWFSEYLTNLSNLKITLDSRSFPRTSFGTIHIKDGRAFSSTFAPSVLKIDFSVPIEVLVKYCIYKDADG